MKEGGCEICTFKSLFGGGWVVVMVFDLASSAPRGNQLTVEAVIKSLCEVMEGPLREGVLLGLVWARVLVVGAAHHGSCALGFNGLHRSTETIGRRVVESAN